MGVHWRIELLGELKAVGADRVLTRFRTRKTGALLAYLAFYHDRSHPREVITELLWPDDTPESARMKLRGALASLRRQLEPPGTPAGSVLMAGRLAVRLNPSAVGIDVTELEAAVRDAGNVPAGEAQTAFLATALRLYRGPLLPGYYEPWILPEQQRLEGLFHRAASQMVRHLEAAGQIGAAIDVAGQALAVDPHCEEAHEELIRLYALGGQPAAAVRQYRELERILNEQFAARPSPQTRRLIEPHLHRGTDGKEPVRRPEDPSTVLLATIAAAPAAVPSDAERLADIQTFLLAELEDPAGHTGPAGCTYQETVLSGAEALRAEIERHGGREVGQAVPDPSGARRAALVSAFPTAAAALTAGLAGRRTLLGQTRPGVQWKMALHTGDVILEGEAYRGPALTHAERLLATAEAGQIVCSELTAGLLRPVISELAEFAGELCELGVRHLPGMASSERIFRIDAPQRTPGEPESQPEAETADPLPLPINRFFGREEERGWLRTLLLEDRERLVSVTGPGGSGKTRLALEAAEEMRAAYHGATWFVPLADLRDPGRIADAILDALRRSRSATGPALEQVVQALLQRPTLLLLDNLEHLLPGAAPVVIHLLERVSSLQCLVMSRRRLGLMEERELALAPLSIPAGPDRPERLMEFAAVQLFVDRVQAVRPDFQVTAGNAAAVAEVCRRLEGIPLALELAAARARLLSPTEMLRQLAVRFDLLSGRRRAQSARHRSLRAALEWSYQLLSPELQRFLGRLSVFRGGWTAEAAAEICEEPGALDYLQELRDSSMVLAEQQEEGIRYRWLETLREYAAEQLTGDGRQALAARHTEYYLALAETAAADARGDDHTTVWSRRLDGEHDNLRAALDWLQQQGRIADGLRLGAALLWFWEVRGHWTEAVERLLPFVDRADGSDRDETYARVLDGAARLAWRRQDMDVSRRLFTEGLALQRERGDRLGVARTLFLMGHLALDQRGDLDQADALYEESQALFEELGELGGVAGTFFARGLLASFRGDHAAARMLWEKRLEIVRGQEDRGDTVDALEPLIELEYRVGEYSRACAYLEERLFLSRRRAQQNGVTLPERAQDPGTAEARDGRAVCHLLRECLETESHFAWRPWLASRRTRLATMMSDQGDYPAARAECEACLPVFRELGQKDDEGQVLLCLGNIAHRQNRVEDAKAAIEASLSLFRQTDCLRMIPEALRELGELASDQGDYRSARSLLEESLALATTPPQRVCTRCCLGALARREGDFPRALALLEECLRLFREMNDVGGAGWALGELGKLKLAEGHPGAAVPLLVEYLTLRWAQGDRGGVAACLEALAAAQARHSADGRRSTERAARLFGAAAALRERIGAPISPADCKQYERDVARARARAGAVPFAAAWADGMERPLEPLIASIVSSTAVEPD